MRLSTGASSFDASFSILAGTISKPDALAGFRFLCSFRGDYHRISGLGCCFAQVSSASRRIS